MRGRAGNANADTDVRFAILVKFILAVERSGHAMRRGDGFCRGSAVQQDGEFVAAQTGRRIALA